VFENLQITEPAELSVVTVLVNLGCATLLSLVLAWHFTRFGSTFSNRRKFANVLPFIALTTVLVISVVKASLALSLGLVGALSIVRFRTPVKEPEELAYLFLAIAVGLGFGADQRLVTVAAVSLILLILTGRAMIRSRAWRPNLFMNLDIPSTANPQQKVVLKDVLDVLRQHTSRVDLRRYDIQDGSFAGTFYVDCDNTDQLTAVQEAVQVSFPSASLTFVDQSSMPGV
jgi:hypothetical protein